MSGGEYAALTLHQVDHPVTTSKGSPVFEISRVFVPVDHVSSFILNANHGIERS
jgi:hypothetical protein